ncbi:MAG: alanine dehydrogenase [Candidatus Omnitrophota bacterium]|nr:alanine dehydrogenase [Candidatus Omnitrophota bacterium]
MNTVGIPREVKTGERRVGLTPQGVSELKGHGLRVVVERGAGAGSGYSDRDYVAAGAELARDAAAVYGTCDLIQKVKEPIAQEFHLLREGQVLFCFLHLASPEQCDLVRALEAARVTAIAFETLEVGDKRPLLAPMSEVAGALAVAYGAYFRSCNLFAAESLHLPDDFRQQMQAIADVYPNPPEGLSLGRVMIFGGGVAGIKAMEFAQALGGEVTVIEKNAAKREAIPATALAPEEITQALLAESEMLLGCVHQTGARALHVLDEQMFRAMSRLRPKLIMDVAIDQGGNFPESHSTTYDEPLYRDSLGNIRFAVANIPAYCGRGASDALTAASVSYTEAMAVNFEEALQKFPELRSAVNVRGGKLLDLKIREAHKK